MTDIRPDMQLDMQRVSILFPPIREREAAAVRQPQPVAALANIR